VASETTTLSPEVALFSAAMTGLGTVGKYV